MEETVVGNQLLANFKTAKDGTRVDVRKYVEKFLEKYPDAEVHIGTDSQQRGSKTVYVTAVAFRYSPYSARGVHYIYAKVKVPRVRDFFQRLYNETLYSLQVAQHIQPITDSHIVEIEIDMDYNSDKKFKSNTLVAAATGFASALGYKVNIKPHGQIATRAADVRCKS